MKWSFQSVLNIYFAINSFIMHVFLNSYFCDLFDSYKGKYIRKYYGVCKEVIFFMLQKTISKNNVLYTCYMCIMFS